VIFCLKRTLRTLWFGRFYGLQQPWLQGLGILKQL
jgi:hypothetical protein